MNPDLPFPPATPPEGVHPATHRSAGALLFAGLLALAGLGVVLAAVPSPLFDLDRHAVPKELVVHATAFLALLWLLRDPRGLRPGVVEALLGAFVAWSAVSALFAGNHWIAGRAFGLSYSAFLVFLCARRIRREGAAWTALAGLGLAAIVGATIGAAQAYGLDAEWLAADRPPGGTFGNRNFLAHFTAIATPALILLAVRARSPAGRAIWIAGLGVAAGAIVLTRSRAGWLGLVGGLSVMAATLLLLRGDTRSGMRPRLRAIGIALLAGSLLGVFLPNRLDWNSDSPYAETLAGLTDYRSGSGRGRLIQYRNSLRLVADAPVLGVGPGNWFVHYPRLTTPGDRAYNADDPVPTNPWPSSDWVAVLTERGLPALLLAVAAGCAAILTSLRRLRDDDRDTALAAATVPAMLAAVFVTGMFDAVLLLAPPAFFVAALTGLLLPLTRPLVERRLEGRRRTVLSATLLTTALVVTLIDAAHFAAIRITRDSTDRATIERALRLDPGNYRLRLRLAARGPCNQRVGHARAAARLLPYHAVPADALRECGELETGP